MTIIDNIKNLAKTTVAAPPAPGNSGVSMALTGDVMPAAPYIACVAPPEGADPSNIEFIRVTKATGVNIEAMTRGAEGSTPRTIKAGDLVYHDLTAGQVAALIGAIEKAGGNPGFLDVLNFRTVGGVQKRTTPAEVEASTFDGAKLMREAMEAAAAKQQVVGFSEPCIVTLRSAVQPSGLAAERGWRLLKEPYEYAQLRTCFDIPIGCTLKPPGDKQVKFILGEEVYKAQEENPALMYVAVGIRPNGNNKMLMIEDFTLEGLRSNLPYTASKVKPLLPCGMLVFSAGVVSRCKVTGAFRACLVPGGNHCRYHDCAFTGGWTHVWYSQWAHPTGNIEYLNCNWVSGFAAFYADAEASIAGDRIIGGYISFSATGPIFYKPTCGKKTRFIAGMTWENLQFEGGHRPLILNEDMKASVSRLTLVNCQIGGRGDTLMSSATGPLAVKNPSDATVPVKACMQAKSFTQVKVIGRGSPIVALGWEDSASAGILAEKIIDCELGDVTPVLRRARATGQQLVNAEQFVSTAASTLAVAVTKAQVEEKINKLTLASTAGFAGNGEVAIAVGGQTYVLKYTNKVGNELTGVTGWSGEAKAIEAGTTVLQKAGTQIPLEAGELQATGERGQIENVRGKVVDADTGYPLSVRFGIAAKAIKQWQLLRHAPSPSPNKYGAFAVQPYDAVNGRGLVAGVALQTTGVGKCVPYAVPDPLVRGRVKVRVAQDLGRGEGVGAEAFPPVARGTSATLAAPLEYGGNTGEGHVMPRLLFAVNPGDGVAFVSGLADLPASGYMGVGGKKVFSYQQLIAKAHKATPKAKTTAGKNEITGLTTTTGVTPGMPVTGTGIPAGTLCTFVDYVGKKALLSKAATATGEPTLTFTAPAAMLGQILVGDSVYLTETTDLRTLKGTQKVKVSDASHLPLAGALQFGTNAKIVYTGIEGNELTGCSSGGKSVLPAGTIAWPEHTQGLPGKQRLSRVAQITGEPASATYTGPERIINAGEKLTLAVSGGAGLPASGRALLTPPATTLPADITLEKSQSRLALSSVTGYPPEGRVEVGGKVVVEYTGVDAVKKELTGVTIKAAKPQKFVAGTGVVSLNAMEIGYTSKTATEVKGVELTGTNPKKIKTVPGCLITASAMTPTGGVLTPTTNNVTTKTTADFAPGNITIVCESTANMPPTGIVKVGTALVAYAVKNEDGKTLESITRMTGAWGTIEKGATVTLQERLPYLAVATTKGKTFLMGIVTPGAGRTLPEGTKLLDMSVLPVSGAYPATCSAASFNATHEVPMFVHDGFVGSGGTVIEQEQVEQEEEGGEGEVKEEEPPETEGGEIGSEEETAAGEEEEEEGAVSATVAGFFVNVNLAIGTANAGIITAGTQLSAAISKAEVEAKAGTINVLTTAGFPTAGTLTVAAIKKEVEGYKAVVVYTLKYTGKTATSFTGVTGWAGEARELEAGWPIALTPKEQIPADTTVAPAFGPGRESEGDQGVVTQASAGEANSLYVQEADEGALITVDI